MRAAAALQRQRQDAKIARRSGVMRGSDAPKRKGTSLAWNPDRAAKRAAERALTSVLGETTKGSGEQCNNPMEAYTDLRYRSYDTVCPVCKGNVPPNLALPWTREIQKYPTEPCKNPEEAYSDARYRTGDKVCPVCNGWLPQTSAAEDKQHEAVGRSSTASSNVKDQPERWKTCAKGQVWRGQGLHDGHMRPVLKQRPSQETVPHSEANAAEQYELGCKLERAGENLARPEKEREADLQEAAGWFRAAAFQGHPKALYRLGLCHLEGKGVEKKCKQALAFLRKAATQEADAAYRLGCCYFEGIGAPRSDIIALGWWQQALNMGHLGAHDAIKKHTSKSGQSKGERFKSARVKYLASRGDRHALFLMAQKLFEGDGVIKDEASAVRNYQRAAAEGHIPAMCALGLCYYFGRGVDIDQAQALQSLSTAAQLGHGIAQGALAGMYAHGVGVERDDARAELLRKQAAQWEERRATAFFRDAALGSGGKIRVSCSQVLEFAKYLREEVDKVQRRLGAVILARRMLAAVLSHKVRTKQAVEIYALIEVPGS
jgi:TPR repeat protein